MGSCCNGLVKVFLAIINIFWLIVGLCTIYIGWVLFQINDENSHFNEMIQMNIKNHSIGILAYGALIVFLSLFGFIGVCVENRKMLYSYAIIITILLLCNCFAIYFYYQKGNDFYGKFDQIMIDEIKKFNRAEDAYALQKIQTIFQCCGWNGTIDYYESMQGKVPSSCCNDANYTITDPFTTCNIENVKYQMGCKDSQVVAFIKSRSILFSIILLIIMVLVILSTCCLACSIREYQPVPSDSMY